MTPEKISGQETQQPQNGWGWRHFVYPAAALAVPAIVILGLAFWYAGTPQFAARVRQTLVSTLEHVTGGRVEIHSFQWSALHLSAEIDGLTIHGKESADQAPYFHVDHLTLGAKIVSFFSPKIVLSNLYAERPVFHLILYPDGTTNQPQPRIASKSALPEALLNLAIDQTRVEDGVILLNNRAIPWEMAAGPLRLAMQYGGSGVGYQGLLEAGNLTFRLKNASEAHSTLRTNFVLRENYFQVENFDLTTGGSQLAATAQVQDFAHPHWQAQLHGGVDARELGALTGQNELRDGIVQMNLKAHGAPGQNAEANFQVTGHIDLRNGEYESDWLRLRKVELHTNLLVDNDQCSLTGFSSILEDQGRITGSLVLKHCVGPSKPQDFSSAHFRAAAPKKSWLERDLLRRLHRPATPTAPKPRHYQPLDADLDAQVTDVTLPLVLSAVAPKQYWDIGFTTATSGHVTARWTGNGDGLDVHGDLTMRAPRQLNGLVPVNGSAHADYLGDHRHLVIQQADEFTPATQVHASGTLTLLTHDLNTNLRLDTTGRNLAEFDQLLTVLDLRVTSPGEPHALPIELEDPVSFHGDIHGSFFALEALGHLDAGRFEMVAARRRQNGASPEEHRLAWDAFHGDLDCAPARIIVRNGELARGHSAISLSLEATPQRTTPDTYVYNGNTQILADARTENASLGDLQSLLGSTYPASGELSAAMHIVGAANDLAGAGHVSLRNAVFDGLPVPSAVVQLNAQNHLFSAEDIQIAVAGGNASGHLEYNGETGALQGDLSGQKIALQQIQMLQRYLPLGGKGEFHLQAAGFAAAPILNAQVQVENLTLNHQAMGRLHAEAHLENKTLLLRSRAEVLDTHVDASGKILLAGNEPAQAELTFSRFNIAPLLRISNPGGMAAACTLEGRIVLSGPAKQPAQLQGSADLKALTITLARHEIHSAAPVEMTLRNGKVELRQVHLNGGDVDVSAEGNIDLLNHGRLRLHSEGIVDAALISSFSPDLTSSGKVRFAVNARGTARQPDLRGRAQIENVNLHMANVTNGLTNMNGEALFDQDRLVIQKLTGSSGGGTLTMNGFIGYRNGIFVDLTATSRGVRIRYPKGVSSSADAKLRLLGTPASMLLNGNVLITRFDVGSSFDLAALASGGGNVSAPIDPNSPLNRVRLDVRVTSAPQLGFQNSLASLAGDVNLRIGGTLENPAVLGRIDITEGTADFAGTKYKLQQGAITFNNPVTISPQIDLEASARVQNYDIIISLHGPPSKLDISYRSEPPLTQADVLALLALGRTNEQATLYGEQQQANANLTSEALLGGALNAAVSSRVQKLFGVGSVRVDPNFVGTLGQSTARVTVEEQVGRSVTLTFATNVNTTAQQLIQAQFDLTHNVSIIAVRDEADVFSTYLQIRGKHK